MKYLCSYTCVEYDKAGYVCGIYSDCFTTRANSKEDAEAYTTKIAEQYNPGLRVFTIIVK